MEAPDFGECAGADWPIPQGRHRLHSSQEEVDIR